jgi:hypothetical protein
MFSSFFVYKRHAPAKNCPSPVRRPLAENSGPGASVRAAINFGTSATKAVDLGHMERKIFWLTFTILDLTADFILPLWWAMGATMPICLVSWWVAYRSDWF